MMIKILGRFPFSNKRETDMMPPIVQTTWNVLYVYYLNMLFFDMLIIFVTRHPKILSISTVLNNFFSVNFWNFLKVRGWNGKTQ